MIILNSRKKLVKNKAGEKVMKCKNCKGCRKGYFKSKPEEYVCIGVLEPFVIKDINSNCTEYPWGTEFKKEEIWSWNETNDESWSHGTFDSREEAIEDALGNIEEIKSYLETDTPTIYVGRCEYIPLPTSVDSERILWDLDEQYRDGTDCEDYIYESVTDEQTKWLEDKLSDLMVEFHNMIGLKSCWFKVVEEEEINLCEYEKEK